ncbi:MAG: type II secretion system secretin GspD [Betaproteobacteria bacterium]|nr:type II secretion system secretin GspD [Betaproteobacteria bacterium]
MKQFLRLGQGLSGALLAGWLSLAAAAEEPVTLNFVNAEIDAVIKAVGEITGRNFLLDPKVKGTLSIISNQPVARHLVYPTLLSALRLQGFTAVEGEGITKIVPEAEARTHAHAAGKAPARGDTLVTKVYTLKNESAGQMVGVLRPLVPANNPISAFPGTNSLVVTDYADNLKRLEQIIEAIDRPSAGEPVLVPLKYASAADLAPTLARVFAENGPAGAAIDPAQRVSIVAELRSNSLILRSDNPAKVARVRTLAAELDTPTRAGGNVQIVYLRNADAVKVAHTLRGVLTGASTAEAPANLSAASPAGGASAPAATLAASVASPASFSTGGVTIHADTASNALIIAAPEAVYNGLRAVIEKLDVRRAQVHVEALVVEVTTDKAAEFGIQWQTLDTLATSSGTQAIGGTNFGARGSGQNIIDVAGNIGAAGQGLNIGVVRGQVTLPGIGTIANLGVLARALETQANANILSTPSLLTLDNEEARIVIGQNVPFITGQYAQSGSTTTPTPFQTIERRDVGLTLKVKPQVTEGGTVRLQIYQEVSNVLDKSNAAGVITNKRSLESTVLVDDGQIVVLGGLIQDSFIDADDKVPLLGDAPLIGALFRYESRKRSKTNLMVFLRPQVLRSASSGQGATADRYDMLLGEQKKQQSEQRFFWKDQGGPQLPPLTAPPARP